MRLGRREMSRLARATRRTRAPSRWAGAVLALLALAPAGALRTESGPCSEPGAARLARLAVVDAAAGCRPCCRETPAAPATPTASCGCCVRGPLPEPTRSPSPAPAFDLIATAAGAEGVLLATLPATPAIVLCASARESAPPARLMHCVHRI